MANGRCDGHPLETFVFPLILNGFSDACQGAAGLRCAAPAHRRFGGKEEIHRFPMVFQGFRVWSALPAERPRGDNWAPMVSTDAHCEIIAFTKVFEGSPLGKRDPGLGRAGPPARVPICWKAGNHCFSNDFQRFPVWYALAGERRRLPDREIVDFRKVFKGFWRGPARAPRRTPIWWKGGRFPNVFPCYIT